MRKVNFDMAIFKTTALTAVFVCLLLVSPAIAQSGGDYEISWSTIDSGGGRSSGGPYVLTGTIGQPDAAYSAGGYYELLGGFWPGGPLCIVDFEEFSLFAEDWLESGPGLAADLDGDDDCDLDDLKMFVYEWLWNCPYDWPLR